MFPRRAAPVDDPDLAAFVLNSRDETIVAQRPGNRGNLLHGNGPGRERFRNRPTLEQPRPRRSAEATDVFHADYAAVRANLVVRPKRHRQDAATRQRPAYRPKFDVPTPRFGHAGVHARRAAEEGFRA